MKITMLTEYLDSSNDDGQLERHSILLNDNEIYAQREMIEPEDCLFHRDLSSPHDCTLLIEMVIRAVKNGEEVIIEQKDIGRNEEVTE